MKNRLFIMVMLAIALVFGMMVIGCGEDEGEPDLPFLLWIEITGGNYKNPVVGDTLTASSSMTGYGTPTWQWYRGNTAIEGANSNIYKVVSGDIGYQLTVRATYSGYRGFDYQETTVVVGTPQTAQVSLSLDTYITSGGSYCVDVNFTLSDGTWIKSLRGSDLNMIKSWLNITGTPNVSDWNLSSWNLGSTSYEGDGGYLTRGQIITISFENSTGTFSNPNLTVTLNTSKFAEIKNSTNIIGSLSAGSPSTVTSSSWVQW